MLKMTRLDAWEVAAMTMGKQWSVDVLIDESEEDRSTRAQARLRTAEGLQLVGSGAAKRHPRDREVPEIGDELAVARALSELSHKLVQAAAENIELVTHERSRVRS